MTNTQRTSKLKEAIQLIIIVNNTLEELYENHKDHCINHNGEGLNPGYTLEDL